MFWVDYVSRVVHVYTAIALVGGSLFTLFVLMPAAKLLPSEAHATLTTAVSTRWKRFVHLGILLFLISGFYNYFRSMELHRGDGLYHALLGTKMLLAFAVFFIASALVGRSEKLAAFRQHRQRWLTVLVALATLIVFFSGYVKVRGIPADLQGTSSSAE
jgi:uncharacterized membrane protein